ncbi:MAG: hypothetical protein ACOC5I_01400, partial [Gemmatimonadota bacterium]
MRSALLTLLAALAVPATLPAQSCGVVPGLYAVGGAVTYDVGGGTSGFAVGGDAALDAGPVTAQLGYRRMLLEGDAADPDVVRGMATMPVVSLFGIDVCPVGHVAMTRFTLGDDTGLVLAGGAGLTVAPSLPGPVRPYLSVRGLAARATGTVLDFDLEADGLSLGVDAGLALVTG